MAVEQQPHFLRGFFFGLSKSAGRGVIKKSSGRGSSKSGEIHLAMRSTPRALRNASPASQLMPPFLLTDLISATGVPLRVSVIVSPFSAARTSSDSWLFACLIDTVFIGKK